MQGEFLRPLSTGNEWSETAKIFKYECSWSFAFWIQMPRDFIYFYFYFFFNLPFDLATAMAECKIYIGWRSPPRSYLAIHGPWEMRPWKSLSPQIYDRWSTRSATGLLEQTLDTWLWYCNYSEEDLMKDCAPIGVWILYITSQYLIPLDWGITIQFNQESNHWLPNLYGAPKVYGLSIH